MYIYIYKYIYKWYVCIIKLQFKKVEYNLAVCLSIIMVLHFNYFKSSWIM